MYAKEFTQIETRIEKMKSDGKDEYDIRKMVYKKMLSFVQIQNNNLLFLL